jgi:large-conductance mechanosensitive channel
VTWYVVLSEEDPSTFKEFKEFAMRSHVLDMLIGIISGASPGIFGR